MPHWTPPELPPYSLYGEKHPWSALKHDYKLTGRHIYGHSHGRLPEVPHSLSMDVGVDTHDFRPWRYDEIADIMRKKTEARALASDH